MKLKYYEDEIVDRLLESKFVARRVVLYFHFSLNNFFVSHYLMASIVSINRS